MFRSEIVRWKSLRTLVSVSAALALSVPLTARADLTVVGRDGYRATHVPAASSAAWTDPVLQHAGGVLYKSGEGTLTVSSQLFSCSAEANVRAVAGTVKAVSAPASASVPAAPTWLAAKATMWFDASQRASHPELFSGATSNDTAFVDRWLDVRETTPAAPTYRYLQANVYTNYCGCAPSVTNRNGQTMIYFGGYGSGRFYDLMQNGALKSITWRNAFFVHAVDKTFGFIFGTYMHIAGWGSAASSITSAAWNALYTRSLQRGRVYVNGDEFDGYVNPIPKGLQVMDVSCGPRGIGSIVSESVFRDRGLFSSSVGYRAGGDCLGELIVFEQELTEEERVELAAYLNAKWRGVPNPGVTVDLADGTSATVEAAAASGTSVGFTGNGRVTASGTVVPRLSDEKGGLFGGELELGSSQVDLHNAYALKVSGGQRIRATAGTGTAAAYVSLAAASAGQIVKAGAGEASLRTIPDDVKRLDVVGGTLSLLPNRAATGSASSAPIDVTIENAGFEEWDAADLSTNLYEKGLSSSAPYHGWYGTDYVSVFDYSRWPENEKGPASGASRKAFGLSQPPVGNCALFMRHCSWSTAWMTACWTYVDIPQADTYTFSCRIGGRQSGYPGTPLDVLLIDEANQVTNRLGRIRYLVQGQYAFVSVSGRVAGSGRHQLRLVWLPPRDLDRAATLDDLKLHRDPAAEVAETVWPIPGGDFEQANLEPAGKNYAATFTTANELAGWTFTQPSDWTSALGVPGVGVVTAAMANEVYNGRNGTRGGQIELFFNSYKSVQPSSAETTFTPPAGTYYLQADAAAFELTATLTATVTIGGNPISLGSDTITSRLYGPHRWSVPFTVDGTQSVTLKLTFQNNRPTSAAYASTGGLWVDNVVLVSVGSSDTEYVSNGGFENGSGTSASNWSIVAINGEPGNHQCNSYGVNAGAFGSDVYAGSRYLLLGNRSVATQVLTFPSRGVYRLTYHSHDRPGTGYEGNVLCVRMVDPNGATNVIGRSTGVGTGFTEHMFLFEIPAAGNYTLVIGGERATGAWAPAYEVLIDGVSIRRVPDTEALAQIFPNESLRVSVASGSFLNLNFKGTNRVSSVRYAGTPLRGIVDAKSAPEFVNGLGALEVVPTGFCILVK